jgi:predicted Zn-dependent protease
MQVRERCDRVRQFRRTERLCQMHLKSGGERAFALVRSCTCGHGGRRDFGRRRSWLRPYVSNQLVSIGPGDGNVREQDGDGVQQVGLSLARQSERPTLPWQFFLLDDSAPNAYAMPGGFIFITRGMLLLASEAQLASVLGHEIGHVAARHTVTQLSRWRVAQMALGLGGFSAGMQAFDSLAGMEPSFLLFYSEAREAERQADQLGFTYLRRTGYAVSEFAEALKRTSANQQKVVPGWLSTHPASIERITTAEKRTMEGGEQPGARVGRAEYLGMLARLGAN